MLTSILTDLLSLKAWIQGLLNSLLPPMNALAPCRVANITRLQPVHIISCYRHLQ